MLCETRVEQKGCANLYKHPLHGELLPSGGLIIIYTNQ